MPWSGGKTRTTCGQDRRPPQGLRIRSSIQRAWPPTRLVRKERPDKSGLQLNTVQLNTYSFFQMAQDHFVAQTYLRQWADPSSGMLRGYGKRTGREFPCAPKDVCREWDWDVNPYFKDNPRLLGDYRKIFEPQ